MSAPTHERNLTCLHVSVQTRIGDQVRESILQVYMNVWIDFHFITIGVTHCVTQSGVNGIGDPCTHKRRRGLAL